MVFHLKQKADGSIDQKDEVDYTETFSPVIKPIKIRVILALAVHFNWYIRQ